MIYFEDELFEAVRKRSVYWVRNLLKNGNDVNITDYNYSDTPLHKAIKLRGYNNLSLSYKKELDEVIKLLVKHGADVYKQNFAKLTPFDIALDTDPSIVKLLVNSGAKVDIIQKNGRSILHKICANSSKSNLDIGRFLIESGANLNIQDKCGQTPLHIATLDKNAYFVNLLLKNGADTNIKDHKGITALHEACHYRLYPNIVQSLIQYKANVNVEANDGRRPLHIAAQCRNRDIIKLLMKGGVDINAEIRNDQSILHEHCGNPLSYEIVKLLIQCGADVNVKTKYGRSPLHIAIEAQDNIDIVKLLLDSGAETDLKDSNGEFLLHKLCEEPSKLEIAKLLMKSGADVNIQDDYGWTPLHTAASWQNTDYLKLLVENHANINARDCKGATALHEACCFTSRLHIVQLLIQLNADVNIKTKNGRRPIHIVVSQMNIDCLKLLIENDADVDAKDKNGVSALHLACYNGYVDIVQLLIQSKANVNAETNDLRKALHIAAVNGKIECVRLLIENGASINARDQNDVTALHEACCSVSRMEIARMLIYSGADVNAEAKNGRKPLELAISNKNNDCSKLLFSYGAKIVEIVSKDKPLHIAIEAQNNFTTMKSPPIKDAEINIKDSDDELILHEFCRLPSKFEASISPTKSGEDLNAEANDNNKQLHNATSNRNIDCLNISIGNDTNTEVNNIVRLTFDKNDNIVVEENDSRFVLHNLCCDPSKFEEAKLLIKSGANLNVRDDNGRTALHVAASHSNIKYLKLLIENRADINAKDFEGKTALHEACYSALNLKVAQILIESGADVNAEAYDGSTPFQIAASVQNIDCLMMLYDKNVNFNAKNRDSKTILHQYCNSVSNYETVKLLIYFRVDVNGKASDGRRPLHIAAEAQNNIEILKLLIDEGADIEAKDNEGNRPLHCAVMTSDNTDTIKFLLENEAEINEMNNCNQTPLHLAKKFRNEENVDTLLQYGASDYNLNLYQKTEKCEEDICHERILFLRREQMSSLFVIMVTFLYIVICGIFVVVRDVCFAINYKLSDKSKQKINKN